MQSGNDYEMVAVVISDTHTYIYIYILYNIYYMYYILYILYILYIYTDTKINRPVLKKTLAHPSYLDLERMV